MGSLRSTNAYLVPGLDVRPPVQEELDGLQVTLLSSPIESGGPTLPESQKQN